MPAHRAFLWPLSEYFSSKFKNWSSNSSTPQVTILVPAGQLDVGKALVIAMYDKLPGSLDQQQLMQLLVMSDRYRIDRVSKAVVDRISSIPCEQLEWDTILAISQLPRTDPLHKPLIATAHARCLQLLGDLELVCALESQEQRQLLQQKLQPGPQAAEARVKAALAARPTSCSSYMYISEDQQRYQDAVRAQEAAAATAVVSIPPHTLLLQLPFEQLFALLQSPQLRTMSENSVHHTITRWLQEHPEATKEQRQQLAQLVCLSKCTPNYLINVICNSSSWLAELHSAADMAQVVAECIGHHHALLGVLQWAHRALQSFSWLLWPASALQALQLSWNVPLAELQKEYEEAAEWSDRCKCWQLQVFCWQGVDFGLEIGMNLKDNHVSSDEVESDASDDDGASQQQRAEPGHIEDIYCGVRADRAADFSKVITVWKVAAGPQSQQPEVYVQQMLTPKRHDYRMFCQDIAYIMIDAEYYKERGPLALQPHVKMQHTASNWAELEQKFRSLGLVHGDNCLHVTAEVTGLC